MVMRGFYSILFGMALLAHTPVQAESIRIMPLGDSITHGYWSGINSDYNSYRRTLRSLLEDHGSAVDFVGRLTDGNFPDNQHEGHDGYYADHATKTNTLLNHVGDWITAADADIILLHIGTNDILDNNADADEVSRILDEIFITKPKATVVLALIINARIEAPFRTDITTYNSNLNAMAQGRIGNGDDILVVDMEHHAGIDYGSADMADRLHPSQIGYDKMATNWYSSTVTAIEWQQTKRKPRIEAISVSTNMLMLELGNLCTGATTRIEQTRTLTPLTWTNVGTIIPATTTTNWTQPIDTSPDTTFFRILTE